MALHIAVRLAMLVVFAGHAGDQNVISHQELQRRLAFANKQFKTPSILGSQTDRGRAYIALGPPDRIENHDGTENPYPTQEFIGYPWQDWTYRSIPGVGKNVTIRFVDSNYDSMYRMAPPPRDDPSSSAVEGRRQFILIQRRIRQTLKTLDLPKGKSH